ncbi:MAG: cohesin domain-containing protein [Candidatus Omnitrophica bacterium]|nr:cohesin domain-containing protein [Candidatus Omnitrophota bacterium]MDD5310378.1 cohesin domain-containing protein [Candidatus Omnitrophota bacterium]MDD5545923.1 cohesin domain-containing protein [Candidatus Omnitrophota bacterium]
MRIKLLTMITALILALFLAPTAKAAVYLSLDPSAQDISAGSQFTVNMGVSNPSSQQMTFLNVWFSFDQNYLEVVDSDSGNWITSGTNVLDGPYHGAFNWDFHGQNSADNGTGRISYGEGSFSTTVTGNGTFAQVTFLAKAPVLNTPINYLVTGTGGLDDTYVTDTDASNILGGVSGASVNVVPEPASLLLLAGGLIGMAFRKKNK